MGYGLGLASRSSSVNSDIVTGAAHLDIVTARVDLLEAVRLRLRLRRRLRIGVRLKIGVRFRLRAGVRVRARVNGRVKVSAVGRAPRRHRRSRAADPRAGARAGSEGEGGPRGECCRPRQVH